MSGTLQARGATCRQCCRLMDVVGMTPQLMGTCCQHHLHPDFLWLPVMAPGDGSGPPSGRSDKHRRAGQGTSLAAALDSSRLLVRSSGTPSVALYSPWT